MKCPGDEGDGAPVTVGARERLTQFDRGRLLGFRVDHHVGCVHVPPVISVVNKVDATTDTRHGGPACCCH